MPQKPTRKKKSEQSLPKSKPLTARFLDNCLNEEVKIFTQTGGCMTGRLIEFDNESLLISPETLIPRQKVVSMYKAKNAPTKTVTGPAVR